MNSKLKKITGLDSIPLYSSLGFRGALEELFGDPEAVVALTNLDRWLKKCKSKQGQFGLLLYTAYQPESVTLDFRDWIAGQLMGQTGSGQAVAQQAADTLINTSAGAFSHATSGAFDIGLTCGGQVVDLGADVRVLDERRHRDYYEKYPPKTPEEFRRKMFRDLLQSACFHFGLIGAPQDIFHYEFGTALWSEVTGQPARLLAAVPDPIGVCSSRSVPTAVNLENWRSRKIMPNA